MAANPWKYSVEIEYDLAEHTRPPRSEKEMDFRIDDASNTGVVSGKVAMGDYLDIAERNDTGFRNLNGEGITSADKHRYGEVMMGWCEAHLPEGSWRYLINDLLGKHNFMQFLHEADMRGFVREFGGVIRQPTLEERRTLMSQNQLTEMTMRAMRGDPEAVAWLQQPITLAGATLKKEPSLVPQTPPGVADGTHHWRQ